MIETILLIAEILGGLTAIIAFIALAVKPIRRMLFVDKASRNGQKCLLRTEILRIYYNNQDKQSLRQYEAQNLELMHQSYKDLGGNSFVDRIYREMQEWKVTT